MGRKARITSAEGIERERRLADIIEMRLAGFTLQMIGQRLNPRCSPQLHKKTIKRALERTVNEATEQARRLEELRLDELTCGLYEKAINGDLAAVDAVLSLMARRARLLGLDAQPVRSSAELHEQPKVLVEIVGGEEMAQAEQTAASFTDARTASGVIRPPLERPAYAPLVGRRSRKRPTLTAPQVFAPHRWRTAVFLPNAAQRPTAKPCQPAMPVRMPNRAPLSRLGRFSALATG